MASNHTPVYGLNQWSLDDGIIMADFNDDNQKTEHALVTVSREITDLQQETEVLRADRSRLELEIAEARREMLQHADALDQSIFVAKQQAIDGDETLQDKINQAKVDAEVEHHNLRQAIDGIRSEVEYGDSSLQQAIEAAKTEAHRADSVLRQAIEAATAEAQRSDEVLQQDITTLRSTMLNTTVGTYVGTGTGGADAPNSLTFSFVPQLLIVTVDISATALENGAYVSGSNSSSPMIALRGAPGASFWYDPISSSADVYANTVTWNDKTVSWWNQTAGTDNAAYMQLNEKGVTYRYFAIG